MKYSLREMISLNTVQKVIVIDFMLRIDHIHLQQYSNCLHNLKSSCKNVIRQIFKRILFSNIIFLILTISRLRRVSCALVTWIPLTSRTSHSTRWVVFKIIFTGPYLHLSLYLNSLYLLYLFFFECLLQLTFLINLCLLLVSLSPVDRSLSDSFRVRLLPYFK